MSLHLFNCWGITRNARDYPLPSFPMPPYFMPLDPAEIERIKAVRAANAAKSKSIYAVAPQTKIANVRNATIGMDEIIMGGRERNAVLAEQRKELQPMSFSSVTPAFSPRISAVIPMNQNYKKGTALGADEMSTFGDEVSSSTDKMSKLDAAAQGLRTTTTRNNYADTLAIRRLQQGDNVLFYDNDGRALYGKTTGVGGIDPLVFEKAGKETSMAKSAYAAGEGGNPAYTNLTLFGNYKPEVIPLDQPFGQSKYKSKGLPADSVVLSYDAKGDVIPVSQLPASLQNRIARRQDSIDYDTTTDGTNLFYKDTAFGWDANPIMKSAHYGLKADSAYPFQPAETLAGMNRVVDDGVLKTVGWSGSNKEKVAGLWQKNDAGRKKIVPFEGERQELFQQYGNIPQSFKDKDGNWYTIQGNKVAATGNNSKRREMETLPQTLYSINQAGQEALATRAATNDVIYRGDPTELGLPHIIANAERGGSGKWTDLADDFDENYNTFYSGNASRADQMTADDRRRGGYIKRYPGGGTTIAPSQEIDDFDYNALKFHPDGYIVDNPGYATTISKERNLPPSTHFLDAAPQRIGNSYVLRDDLLNKVNNQLDYVLGRQQLDYNVANNEYVLSPAFRGEVLPAVTQRIQNDNQLIKGLNNQANALMLGDVNDIYNRPTLRFPTTNETPLSLQQVNQYGYAESPYVYPKDYNGRRIPPLSIQRRNGEELPHLAAKGRRFFVGDIFHNDSKQYVSKSDPLVLGQRGFYIPTPPSSKYLPVLPSTDSRVIESVAKQEAAIANSQNYKEEFVNPFTRQYNITLTEDEIPGVIPEGAIEGAYLPVTRDRYDLVYPTSFSGKVLAGPPNIAYNNDKPIVKPHHEHIPYKPVEKLLDQHLADVSVELDGVKYPLTSAATTLPYLPSANQLSADMVRKHGVTKVDVDDNISYGYWDSDGPDDAWLESQVRGKATNFNPDDDFLALKNGDNSEIYNNPDIAPTDIISALDSKRQELNRIKAGVTNLQTSPTARIQDKERVRAEEIERLNNFIDEQLTSFNVEDPKVIKNRLSGARALIESTKNVRMASPLTNSIIMNTGGVATEYTSYVGQLPTTQLKSKRPALQMTDEINNARRQALTLRQQLEDSIRSEEARLLYGYNVKGEKIETSEVEAVRAKIAQKRAALNSLPLDIPIPLPPQELEPVKVTETITKEFPTLSSKPIDYIWDKRLKSRFMTEEEAQRIAYESTLSPKKTKVVVDEDGESWVEEVDNISAKDLTNITNTFPDRQLTLQELEDRASFLERDIAKAQSAVYQLQGLEPVPEVKVGAIAKGRKANTLAEQMELAGLAVNDSLQEEGLISGTGVINPGSNLRLPVRYNNVEEQDLELKALALQGRRDEEAAQRLIDFNDYYRQSGRMQELGGLPYQPQDIQLLGEQELDQIQNNIARRAGKAARLDRLADVQAEAFADILSRGEVFPELDSVASLPMERAYGRPRTTSTERPWIGTPTKTPRNLRNVMMEGEVNALIPSRQQETILVPPHMKKSIDDYLSLTGYDKKQIGRKTTREQFLEKVNGKAYASEVEEYDNLIRNANEVAATPIAVTPTQEPVYDTIIGDPNAYGNLEDGLPMKSLLYQMDNSGNIVNVQETPSLLPRPDIPDVDGWADYDSSYNPFAGQDVYASDDDYGYTSIPVPVKRESVNVNTLPIPTATPTVRSIVPVNPNSRNVESVYEYGVYPSSPLPHQGRSPRRNSTEPLINPVLQTPYTSYEEVVNPASTSTWKEKLNSLPPWAIPVGLGGIYLGAAGINAYQREQEILRRENEAELRRFYF